MTDPLVSQKSSSSLDEKLSSLLSSSKFSVASYLNLALGESSNGQEELQRRMAELALHLQIQTQSCHEDIGRIGAELQAILPRCAADIGRVGVGLEGMKVDAQTLAESVALDENEAMSSAGSLETLSTLHALQSNLARTKEILTAAATWDSTIASIPPLLAQQNLTEAVDALAQLESGEQALKEMPQRKERQEAISKIRKQVQVLLQPQLKHALQNMNSRLAPLQQCVALYSKLNKMDSLRDEYVKNRPSEIHKAWFAYSPTYSPDGTQITTTTTTTIETKKNVSEFSSWLPSWYDAILSLLTEERRQSSSVFGPEATPDVLVMVLQECFRPILPSFQSRLETVLASDASVSTKGGGSSFETICTTYESTLRFLSLAYEVVSVAYLDILEAGSISQGDGGIALYTELLKVFSQVAKPFVKYIQNFHELEESHLQMSTLSASKDIQKSVGSVSLNTGLESLQDATERLRDLAPLIFPMTQGSLNRFELLNGGYRVGELLTVVDKILADHVAEIVIAIKTLSAAITMDVNLLASLFDEQFVLCAMEMLKLAGSFRRDLRGFEDNARGRLNVMMERIIVHLKEKVTIGQSVFTLPDSLSMIEIDSFLTEKFCLEDSNPDDDSKASLSLLQQLVIVPDAGQSSLLYPKTEEAMNSLADSCHTFVFSVCSAVPRKHLSGMSELGEWGEGAATDSMDSYGTLPQSYITQVGEHMLALVQAFEPFAEDPERLALANEVMDGVRDVAVQPWTEFVSSAGLLVSESVVTTLMDGRSITSLVLNNVALTEEDAAFEDEISDAEKASATFCNAWLDAIGLAVTGRLLERSMQISQLTPKGCEHLAADFNYLINVFSALGVAGHPHPLVSHLASLAGLNDDELRVHILSRRHSNPVEDALRSIELRIALVRGVSID